jgi:hypothetical protein
VPGLHFLGAPAMFSFGPVLRFVSGTEFAADTLARQVGEDRASARSRAGTALALDPVAAERTGP